MNAKIKKNTDISTKKYQLFIEQLKTKVQQAQLKAALSVNSELIKLYFEIGQAIVEKQKDEGWGTGVMEKIGRDLQNMFPGMQGFSRANIFQMRAFYLAYAKVSQAVRLLEKLPIMQIPWGHNVVLITKIKDLEERLWYAEQTIANGLSRSALEDWIKTNVYKRKGKAVTNFSHRLPSPQSQLAQETFPPSSIHVFRLGRLRRAAGIALERQKRSKYILNKKAFDFICLPAIAQNNFEVILCKRRLG